MKGTTRHFVLELINVLNENELMLNFLDNGKSESVLVL